MSKIIETYNRSFEELDKFKSDFIKFYNENCKFLDKTTEFSSIEPLDLMLLLLFGESRYNDNISKKIDFNKNKNLLRTILLNSAEFREVCVFLYNFLGFYGEKLDSICSSLENLELKGFNEKFTMVEHVRILYLINSITYEFNGISSFASGLLILLNKLTRNNEIPNLKKDTLKRYYFNYTYDLKNNIKIFDKDSFMFGEINSIMRKFDKVFDFIFGDFIGIYFTLTTNLSEIIR